MATGGTDKNKAKCGLCNSSKKKLTKTSCCNNWICDDWHTYVMFSYARNSCNRNHDRFTLCSYHVTESHQGSWQDCKKCKDDFDTPTYVYYGTNEYNFEVLKNPEKVSVACSNCGVTADTIGAFPLSSYKAGKTHYYCAKEECQKVGFPH